MKLILKVIIILIGLIIALFLIMLLGKSHNPQNPFNAYLFEINIGHLMIIFGFTVFPIHILFTWFDLLEKNNKTIQKIIIASIVYNLFFIYYSLPQSKMKVFTERNSYYFELDFIDKSIYSNLNNYEIQTALFEKFKAEKKLLDITNYGHNFEDFAQTIILVLLEIFLIVMFTLQYKEDKKMALIQELNGNKNKMPGF